MKPDDIYAARESIKMAASQKEKQLKQIEKLLPDEDDLYTLEIKDDKISIYFMDILVTSTPRIVKLTDGSYGSEFLFSTNHLQNLDIEVFRFYQTPNGQLYTTAEYTLYLGDYNNENNIKSIILKIISGVLTSEIYSPSTK